MPNRPSLDRFQNLKELRMNRRLATGELHAALADDRVEAVREAERLLEHLRLARRGRQVHLVAAHEVLDVLPLELLDQPRRDARLALVLPAPFADVGALR